MSSSYSWILPLLQQTVLKVSKCCLHFLTPQALSLCSWAFSPRLRWDNSYQGDGGQAVCLTRLNRLTRWVLTLLNPFSAFEPAKHFSFSLDPSFCTHQLLIFSVHPGLSLHWARLGVEGESAFCCLLTPGGLSQASSVYWELLPKI